MIDTAKYDFPKVHLPEPARHVRLSDLERALVTAHLHNRLLAETPSRRVRNPWTDRFVSVRPRQPWIIREVKKRAESKILEDLQDGSLPTYVSSDEKSTYYAIQPDFWQSPYCGLSIDGTLIDFTAHGIIPAAMAGNTIYVAEEPAFRWLLKRKIRDDNPDYPRSLQKSRPLQPAKMPSNDKIKAKMIELMTAGYTKNDAAKRIGLLPGFRGVGNAVARSVIEELSVDRRAKGTPLAG